MTETFFMTLKIRFQTSKYLPEVVVVNIGEAVPLSISNFFINKFSDHTLLDPTIFTLIYGDLLVFFKVEFHPLHQGGRKNGLVTLGRIYLLIINRIAGIHQLLTTPVNFLS